MCLQEVGCEGMDWINLAQDRDKWGALVHSFIHSSLYLLCIHIQVKYQGCGNSRSYCKNICQDCRSQIFKYNYNTMVTRN